MLILLFLALNLAAYALFARDKSRARSGGWRTPEATFLTLALLGAWPGLKLGQHRLRHKTRKQPFGWLLNGAALLNMVLVAFLIYAEMAA